MVECYMCPAEGVSREHVPPQCFFPEDSAYRVNLITVRSCHDHNMFKSKDDEYVFFLVVANLLSNKLAEDQFRNKILKAIAERPHLKELVFGEQEVVYLRDSNDGNIQQSLAIKIDAKRLIENLEGMVRALHYPILKKSGQVMYRFCQNSFGQSVMTLMLWQITEWFKNCLMPLM